jgi:hypothetical protein
MSGQQQQTIYTIHESQLNNSAGGQFQQQHNHNGDVQHRGSNSEVLIDTSSIPMTHQTTMPPMQHQHLEPTQAGQQQADTITSQPMQGGQGGGASSSARVAPENQSIVYSVHPVFSMLDNHNALLVRQKADCTSTCCGFESVNTYTVRGKDGSPILKAIESEYPSFFPSCFHLHNYTMRPTRGLPPPPWTHTRVHICSEGAGMSSMLSIRSFRMILPDECHLDPLLICDLYNENWRRRHELCQYLTATLFVRQSNA